MPYKLIILTCLAMLAFAANSILCRLALVDPANSPVGFTLLRLFSGALALAWLLKRGQGKRTFSGWGWLLAPLLLFSYALFFSLAYVRIGAGTGALILFSSVQLTMMGVAFARGHRLSSREAAGFVLAAGGFVYLVLPGVGMPSPVAAGLMAVAGFSWGFYSLLGLGGTDPVFKTALNFALTLPLVLVLGFVVPCHLTREGMSLAIVSGAVASGMGYVLWYSVLKDLAASTASIVQLSVPAIAALAGAMILGETVQARLMVATGLIFGGIALKVFSLPRRIP